MQAVGNQGVFQFQHLLTQLLDAFGGVQLEGRINGQGPSGLHAHQVQLGCLGLHQNHQLTALVFLIKVQTAPAVDRGFKVGQSRIQARLGHGGREVADQRGCSATLGDGTLGGVIGSVKVEIGQLANHAVWPAQRGHAVLFARHELQSTVGAKVQHRIGVEVFFQVTVESRKSMGGCKTFFKQQTHGVAFVAEGGLHRHQEVAVLLTHDENALPVGQLFARCGAPLRFNFGQPLFATNVLLGRNQGVHIGVSTILLGVTVQNAIAQSVHALG